MDSCTRSRHSKTAGPRSGRTCSGVTAEARSLGLGTRLKLAQRDATLAMGLDLIEWTYDPLQAMNAHLNFAKLGVVVSEYEENIYGESSSPSASRHPDRSLRCRVESARTARRATHRVHRGHPGEGRLGGERSGRQSFARRQHLDRTGRRRSLVRRSPAARRDPGRFQRDAAHSAGPRDRVATGDTADLSDYFGRGYRAVDFFLSREAERGQYLLAQNNAER